MSLLGCTCFSVFHIILGILNMLQCYFCACSITAAAKLFYITYSTCMFCAALSLTIVLAPHLLAGMFSVHPWCFLSPFLLGYSHVSHTMLTYQTWCLGLWRKMPYGRCISTNEGHVMKSIQNDDNVVTNRGQEEAFCHAPTLAIWNIHLNSSMVVRVFLFRNM
jgi:hypothetical protein